MIFRTVFDAAEHGYATWWFPALGLIPMAAGALIVFKPTLVQKVMPSGLQGSARVTCGWLILIFASLWAAINFAKTYAQYATVEGSLEGGKYSVVEGPITNFIPMPYRGHSEESFTVKGQCFSYSDYVVTLGFHNSASHGGPLREGLYARVTYIGNTILRLEIEQSS